MGFRPSFATRTPDCVRLRRGGSTPILPFYVKNNSPTIKGRTIIFGGDDGSRTHVRKSIPETFYERSLSFEIPSEKRR